MLSLIFRRLALSEAKITRIVLDSSKVSDIPIEERIATLDQSYPVDLGIVDIEYFRKMLQREIASMHREPDAKKGGNAQKRIRICLSKPVAPDQLLIQSDSSLYLEQVPDHTPGLNETESKYLRTARRGQGQFRKDLINAYAGTCPITGIANTELLVASHIKPWKACTNNERLDPENGILLSALIDRLFDRGLITFNEDGGIIVSPLLSSRDSVKCGLEHTYSIALSKQSQLYMHYHRTIEFKSK